jgi:hypothetical protein
MDLGRLLAIRQPVRRVTYDSADAGSPTLAEVVRERTSSWWA